MTPLHFTGLKDTSLVVDGRVVIAVHDVGDLARPADWQAVSSTKHFVDEIATTVVIATHQATAQLRGRWRHLQVLVVVARPQLIGQPFQLVIPAVERFHDRHHALHVQIVGDVIVNMASCAAVQSPPRPSPVVLPVE